MSRLNYGTRFGSSAVTPGNGATGLFHEDRKCEPLLREYQRWVARAKENGWAVLKYNEFLRRIYNPFPHKTKNSPESNRRGVLKRASVMTKAPVHLAGVAVAASKPEIEKPRNCHQPAQHLLLFEAVAPDYRRTTSSPPPAVLKLVEQGFLCVNPRNPEAHEYALTRKGKEYCDWLRSKK